MSIWLGTSLRLRVSRSEERKQKTAYEMLACDWSSDVCSDLKENLLEVEQVTVEDFKRCDEDLTVEGTQHPSWYLRVSWTYVAKDSGFDTSDYETLQDIYIIKNVDSGRYEIVQIYGME